MPALVGPFIAVALGAALAWLGRVDAPREDEETMRARTLIVALFAILVFAPAVGYFVMFAGDWSLYYVADSQRVPSALFLLLVLLDAALVVAGFAAGVFAARRRASRALAALVLGPAAIALLQVVAFLPKLKVDGTFHQVTSRFGTQPVAGSSLGVAIVWMGAMIAVGLFITARALTERPRVAITPVAEGAPPRGKQPMLGRKRRSEDRL